MHIYTQKWRFVTVFVVSLFLYGWAWATESSCPRGSGVRKYWSRHRVRSVGCLGHATLIFMSAQRNGISPFLCQPLCVLCVCLCVSASMTKAMRRQEDSALPWTLSLCYKSLLYAFCMLSPFELSLSLLLLAVFPFYLLLWFAHCKTSSWINTFHGSQNTAQKHFGGKKNAPKSAFKNL